MKLRRTPSLVSSKYTSSSPTVHVDIEEDEADVTSPPASTRFREDALTKPAAPPSSSTAPGDA